MRILYLLRSKAYFTYHESVVRALCDAGHEIELLFDEGWSKGASDQALRAFLAEGHQIEVGWAIRRKGPMRRPLFAARELRSYSSYLAREGQSEFYLNRWKGYMPAPLRLLVKPAPVRSLLARDKAQTRFRNFEGRVAPDARIIQRLKERRPDVVVASPINMRYSEEVEYVKAAKALGIPTVVPVLSWDNLTTKGLFHVVPDLTLAWNQAHLDEAVTIHNVPPDRVVITGSPFFDKWFESGRVIEGRDEFCRKVGLDPSRPFVAYLGSSANIARDETWLVRELAARFREHPNKDLRGAGILARPHPANARVYDQLSEENVRVWPRQGTLPDSVESKQDFLCTVRYAVAAAGINTTGMIDAVISGRPTLTIMTEKYRATQSQAVHFKHLLDSGALEVVEGADGCAEAVERIWKGEDGKKEARLRFVQRFVRPNGLDRPAGEVAARAIEMAALGKTAPEIMAAMSPAQQVEEASV